MMVGVALQRGLNPDKTLVGVFWGNLRNGRRSLDDDDEESREQDMMVLDEPTTMALCIFLSSVWSCKQPVHLVSLFISTYIHT